MEVVGHARFAGIYGILKNISVVLMDMNTMGGGFSRVISTDISVRLEFHEYA